MLHGREVYAHERTLQSDPVEAQAFLDGFMRELALRAFTSKELKGFRLAIEEALVNAIKHGNHLDVRKKVVVRYTIEENEVRAEIEDEGRGFNPGDVPDPTNPENLERPSGRGLLLMKHYLTEYEVIPPGNRCRLLKRHVDSSG